MHVQVTGALIVSENHCTLSLMDGLKASPLKSSSGSRCFRCLMAVANLAAPPTGSCRQVD